MISKESAPVLITDDAWRALRAQMVQTQIIERGVKDERVLQAMNSVPRHLFVPEEERPYAYRDYPLAIGFEQTISQPYIVAYMTEKLQITANDKVLEIGAGSGYQTAVLAELAEIVYSVEIIPTLYEQAEQRLKSLGYRNIRLYCGNGYKGRLPESPFDAIILTAAPPAAPLSLLQQLASGGRMILPLGRFQQELALITKSPQGRWSRQALLPVRFVPMTGEPTQFADLH